MRRGLFAIAAEESGFEPIWIGQHVAMPIRDNPGADLRVDAPRASCQSEELLKTSYDHVAA